MTSRETSSLLPASILAGASYFGLELFRVALLERRSLASVWEIQHGGLSLGPTWILLGGISGVLAGGVAASLTHHSLRACRLALAALVVPGLLSLGMGISGGRHFSTIGARIGFAFVLAALGGAVSFGLTPALKRYWLSHPKRLAGVFFGLTLALTAVNELFLRRLYLPFHAFLSLASAMSFALSVLALLRPLAWSRWARALPYGLLLLCLVVWAPASRRGRNFDNFRFVMSEGSATLALGIRCASLIAPPPELDQGGPILPLGARRQASSGLDLRGRDIVLITVDALRADHLGAYGYSRATSPFLDELARSSTIFQAAYAPTPHTSYSLTSLMTGKFMRPLLQLGAGSDSELWPEFLRTYGYRTAAFYPPAVFFIDGPRFAPFRDKNFGFEYVKVEFAEGDLRISQIRSYLEKTSSEHKLFLWVHLFGPHEPYEDPEQRFGPRDIDRYDAEIGKADQTIREIVGLARKRDPRAAVIVSADHGEEFGEHGGRYHGTTVYEEQVRVPLLVSVPGLTEASHKVEEPVSTIDLLPTVLSGLNIPIPPRVRGRDLGELIQRKGQRGEATKASIASPFVASAETEEYAMIARGNLRLICHRKSMACSLFDLATDPSQLKDLSSRMPEAKEELRSLLRAQEASHGQYEAEGLRAEGRDYPKAILRGIAGDRDAASEIAPLLNDADAGIRRKAAELLFLLKDEKQAASMRLSFAREEDETARNWLSLGLARLGQGVPLAQELLRGPDPSLRRFAALALGEQGDAQASAELVHWLSNDAELSYERALEILQALEKLKAKEAVPVLLTRLSDVRLRPQIASVLGRLGNKDIIFSLSKALSEERYVSSRLPLARAVLALGGRSELVPPLRHFLGVPDALPGGLALALEADLVAELGGPGDADLKSLGSLGGTANTVEVSIPPRPRSESASGKARLRLIALAKLRSAEPGWLVFQAGRPRARRSREGEAFRQQPTFSEGQLRLEVPIGAEAVQLTAEIPEAWGFRDNSRVSLDVFVSNGLELLAFVVLPERLELPPPPPEPWEAAARERGQGSER